MRLIDAEALKTKWYEINDIDENDKGARFVGYTEIARLIDQAPTVSWVVRCKDCRHYKKINPKAKSGMCYKDIVASAWSDDGFCSRGERND